jgi:rhomboid protease GluP
MDELVELRRTRRQRDAEQLALVMAAAGIGCDLVAGRGGIGLYVAAFDAARASDELNAYERENAAVPSPPPTPGAGRDGLGAALAFGAVLMLFFGAQQRDSLGFDWSALGAAQAGLIQGGAWWRTITALTLHVDHGHLLGNLAAGLVFGMLVAQLLGAGLAWLAILLTGALGNLLNASLQPPDHAAIGASTALFGALGILAGFMRQRRVVPWRGGIRRWAPISAGILLLVFLGFGGERTDVGAHVAGFAIGGLLGLALGRWGRHIPQGRRAQWLYGLVAAGLVAGAWSLALLSG